MGAAMLGEGAVFYLMKFSSTFIMSMSPSVWQAEGKVATAPRPALVFGVSSAPAHSNTFMRVRGCRRSLPRKPGLCACTKVGTHTGVVAGLRVALFGLVLCTGTWSVSTRFNSDKLGSRIRRSCRTAHCARGCGPSGSPRQVLVLLRHDRSPSASETAKAPAGWAFCFG